MQLTERYAAREVRFLELWASGGWRMKVYGLRYRGREPQSELVAAAKACARRCLPEPPLTPDRYGVGFMGVHEGRGGNLVFVSWWSHENELRQRTFVSTGERPAELADVTADGLAACVWDIAVIAFERNAWVASALLEAGAPDLERYLASRFEGAV